MAFQRRVAEKLDARYRGCGAGTEALQGDEPRIEAQEFIDAGDQTVVAVRMSGRGKASGVEVDGRLFQVVTEDHDKLVRVEWYTSRAEALKAVGMTE